MKAMTLDDWDKSGGAVCPLCEQETVRFRPEDGLCMDCARNSNEKEDLKQRMEIRRRKFIKNHNARIERAKKRGAV